MKEFKLFGNDLINLLKLMGAKSLEITADVFSPWHCFKTVFHTLQPNKVQKLLPLQR